MQQNNSGNKQDETSDTEANTYKSTETLTSPLEEKQCRDQESNESGMDSEAERGSFHFKS